MPRFLALMAAIAAPVCLGGCDLAAAGPFMPPILPGVGFPLTGVVLDANTRLPIGGATVQSGFGSTITDGNGHFNLYGGLGSREVSCSRAGYTAVTDGDVDPNLGGDLQFELQPVFSSEQSLPTRFLQLAGPVTGLPANAPALVTFGGQFAPISNGLYQLDFGAQVPGKAFSAVMAWGTTNGAVNVPNQSFNFTSFYYLVKNWEMGDNVPAGHHDFTLATPLKSADMVSTSVKYGNVTPTFASVQTEILLDFGVLGSVTVARATASNQAIPVPKVTGLKYDIVGTAINAAGNGISTVQLTTNDPSQATFQLLGIPKITSPANNAKGAGQRPTFAWTPVPQDDVLYMITLTEENEGTKWVGRTRHSEIQYPGFSQGDINGGALRTDKKYTWTLDVIDALGATDLPTSKAGPVPVKPYRIRQRRAVVQNNGFTP
ncbi:MAG: hypothetical protein JWM80_1430 [Cyanobacteria bacterium RYN_339]|nr:hypothetical protein [Cyanobacteria bacterium RYN_339]